jgi:chromosome partitioning protein
LLAGRRRGVPRFKSTTAAHLIVALLKRGFRVGSMDLDARQGTLSRLLDNRAGYAERAGLPLELPEHRRVHRSESSLRDVAEAEEKQALERALEELADRDYIVIDTPGSDSFLARAGHACAEVLITPMNDSFLDLDLLARIDPEGRQILGPSRYSQMVWEQRQQRALVGLPPTDWIVMRNRLSHIESHNKREIGRLLELLSQRIRFRLAPGFGERVIFRELFPKGLTLLDLRDDAAEFKLSLSHVAARQEVRALLQSLSLPSNGESTSKEAESADNNAVRASRVPSGPRTTGPFRQLSSSPRRRETAPIRLGSANPAAPRGPRPRLTPPCLAERILVSGAKRKLPSTPHLSRR